MTTEFDQSKFPHITSEDLVDMGNGKIWPVCNLKDNGGCQSIALVPDPETGDKLYWEFGPTKDGCVSCAFHKAKCGDEH